MNILEALKKTVSTGPLNLPVIIFPLVIAWILYHFIIKLLYRNKLEYLQKIDKILFNVLFIIVISWKLSPLVFQFSTIVRNPAGLLYLPGGIAGVVLGIAAALIYSIISILRLNENRIKFLKRLGFNIAILFSMVIIMAGITIFITARMKTDSSVYKEMTGRKAPDLTLEAEDGNVYSLSDYYGKTVVINFWASWCPPCRAELPELENFYNSISTGDGKTIFISVNMYASEQNPDNLKEFIEEQGLSFPVLLDRTGSVTNDYAIESIPTTVIIDSGGIIISILTGAVTESRLRAAVRKLP